MEIKNITPKVFGSPLRQVAVIRQQASGSTNDQTKLMKTKNHENF